MPVYVWKCAEHGNWDVQMRVADMDLVQACPTCGSHGTRQLTAPNIDKTAAGSWNQQSYNHGLGCWTKSQKHAEQIAKSRGLEPVGNEPPDNLHKAAEKTQQEIRDKRWAEADRVKLYD